MTDTIAVGDSIRFRHGDGYEYKVLDVHHRGAGILIETRFGVPQWTYANEVERVVSPSPGPRHFRPIYSGAQVLLLERDRFGDGWLIWLSYNYEKTAGTYVQIHEDGRVMRYTLSESGEVVAGSPE